MDHLEEYSKAYSKLRERAGLRLVDGAVHTAHLGRPDGKACRDYHKQCREWADKVGLLAGLAYGPSCWQCLRLNSCVHLHRVNVTSIHSTCWVTRTRTY